MSNHMFNLEKEIKKLENQLLKLSKNSREKGGISLFIDNKSMFLQKFIDCMIHLFLFVIQF